jgi:hypothetical protein
MPVVLKLCLSRRQTKKLSSKMKQGIHLQKKRKLLITKEGSGIIYNLVAIIKKRSLKGKA